MCSGLIKRHPEVVDMSEEVSSITSIPLPKTDTIPLPKTDTIPLPKTDTIPLPKTDTIPLPTGVAAASNSVSVGKKRNIKLVRYGVNKPADVPLPLGAPATHPDALSIPPLPPGPPPEKISRLVGEKMKDPSTIISTVSSTVSNVKKDKKSTISNKKPNSEMKDIKRTLMQKERNIEGPMEQSIVDEMFKDFLASKMQQIETEYIKERQGTKDGKNSKDETIDSVEEMNKLLDEELDTINQNTPIKMIKKDQGEVTGDSLENKCPVIEKSVNKSKLFSKGDVKNKKESRSSKHKSHTNSNVLGSNPKIETSEKVVNVMGNTLPSFQVKLFVGDNDKTSDSPENKSTIKTEKNDQTHMTETSTEDPSNSVQAVVGPKKLSTKLPFKINVSKTSAELISSGLQEKDLARVKALEEGEVLSSNGDVSESNDEEDESEDDKDDEVSGTGSISDSDKESKGSKAKKKKKKKKNKHKKKKKHKSSKHKEKDSDKNIVSSKRKHRSKSRSKSPKKHRKSHSRSPVNRHSKRSRSHSQDRDKCTEKWVDKGFDAYAYRDTVRDRDRDRSSDKDRGRRRDSHRGRSRSRSHERDRPRGRHRSRSRSRDREKDKGISDLRVKIDKAKLREIAIKNALAMAKTGQGPSVDITTVKAGGKSVGELTDFCKRISSKEKNKDDYLSSSSSESEEEKEEKEDTFIHHPFKVRDASSAIVMNIRNAKTLPVMTPQEKVVENSKLRLQFPVSSGSTHRLKESEWIPVEKTTAPPTVPKATPTTAITTSNPTSTVTTATTAFATTAAGVAVEIGQAAIPPPIVNPPLDALPPPPPPEDKVFPDPPVEPIDISSIISERLNAVRKLQANPRDLDAMRKISNAQKKASLWAQSKQLPGQFTGSTGVQILSQDELIGPNKKRQAWAKKDQFTNALPLSGGIGMALLQKMGWKQGTGLGKNNEGSLEPLALDFKTDRKGLTSQEENPQRSRAHAVPMARDLSGKHPVSALVELCNKRKWGSPDFQLVHESGPDHKKHFLFKVMINGTEYQPSVASNNKKLAKAAAATACLQELGLVPRT